MIRDKPEVKMLKPDAPEAGHQDSTASASTSASDSTQNEPTQSEPTQSEPKKRGRPAKPKEKKITLDQYVTHKDSLVYKGVILKGKAPEMAYRGPLIDQLVSNINDRFSEFEKNLVVKATVIASLRSWPEEYSSGI